MATGEWVSVLHLDPAPSVGDSYFVKFPDGNRSIAKYLLPREYPTESFWLCGQEWVPPGYGGRGVLFWSEKIEIPPVDQQANENKLGGPQCG